MSRPEVVPFSDKHVADAAALLAARHARHRDAEPLLPELEDPSAAIETEWSSDGASGVFSRHGYLIAAPQTVRGVTWMRARIAGQAIEADLETRRDPDSAAGPRRADQGQT